MDRLISLEPTNVVKIKLEPGQKCYGELTLKNVMYTMPVAFRLQPVIKTRYTIRPQTGIILPLQTVVVEITCHLPPNSSLHDSAPYCDDSFLLHSVVAPGASMKDPSSAYDSVPNDWFTTKKKQVFIDSGIKVMFVGSLVLAHLVNSGNMDALRDVLEKSQPPQKAADSFDTEGRTLLHLAIAQGRPDLVQLILEFGPNVEALSRSGTTPLEAAAASGEELIVELLLARRAKTDKSKVSSRGAIHLAVGNGHIEVLRLLLLNGADVNSLTKDGNTALHIAVEERRRDCVKLLLANSAKPDVRNGHDGDTPLHIAANLGDEQMVKLLLEKGANKDIRNKTGKTAYDVAAENGYTKLFDVLRLGDSLCVAARKGDVRTIHRLLEQGASINGRDQHGWTALHRASFKGRLEAVRVLVERGIEIDAKDEEGYTAMHCAVEAGHVDVIEFLIKKGADVEARTNKGVNALQIAESLSYIGITRILLINGGAKKDDAFFKVGKQNSLSFKKGVAGKDVAIVGTIQKTKMRSRINRGSLDRSAPLAVL
ncbi:ubiquitin-protein ligase [Lithospermum erythrorhizon]|uniref:Ubiquitin-protein ligase n=1 Tax=Lithospermum erythrorhizon TaxID=34254 RepID=A0AAV3NSA1_LITER